MKQVINLLEGIINPPKEFTPIPFWFFNDEPDLIKIEQQLKDYVEKGVHGIVLHPRIGIPKTLPYLSESYFDVVRFIVKTAEQLEMKIVLYDEGMYPSGSAHGMVAARNPEFAAKGITIADKPEGKSVVIRLKDGRYLVSGYTKGTIRGIHFGEDDGEEAPAAADILNPAAVELFIHMTHDRYYEKLKEFFGNTIIGFFTDEPCALGRNAEGWHEWAEGMDQEIVEAGGRLEELSALFLGETNSTTDIYHSLVKKHLKETFYAPLSKWCEAHGILLMGHPAESDDVDEERYFHVPGQDLIMRQIEPKTGGLFGGDSVQAKLTADIARHSGCRRNSNECFGVCGRNQIPWYFTGEDMKWYIDWLGIRGVNLFIPHAFYYSVAGKRKEERPPDVGPNNIWWKHYRKFSDYMKRMSFLMSDSQNCARVAVLCDNHKVPHQEVAVLYENQIEFNYLPVSMLADCTVENGLLCIQGYCYNVIFDLLDRKNDSFLSNCRVVGSADEILKMKQYDTGEHVRTVETSSVCKNLRAVHLMKEGTDLYLLSNEGEDIINTELKMHAAGNPILVDLWNGMYTGINGEQSGGECCLHVTLEPCETMLIVMEESEHKVDNSDKTISLGNWTKQFVLIQKAGNQAVYKREWEIQQVYGCEMFEAEGEEMAECYCNGQFAGVSFWNTHRFLIGPYLKTGKNDITLILTGNAANLYSNAKINYGLREGSFDEPE